MNRISLRPGDTIFLHGGVIFQGPLRLPAGCAGRKDGNKESGLVLNTCRHITAGDLLVDSFQKSGIYIYQSSYIRILRATTRDNGYAGIAVEGSYAKHDCDHVLIKDCRAENNPGDPTNLSNHRGNRPVGIWVFEADSVTIRHCISFRNRTAKGAEDGGG